MTLSALTPEEREVVERAVAAMLSFAEGDHGELSGSDFQTRLGLTQAEFRYILDNWAKADDSDDQSDVCLAINNSLNELCHGLHVDDSHRRMLTGADLEELRRIYFKWAKARGWHRTGIM